MDKHVWLDQVVAETLERDLAVCDASSSLGLPRRSQLVRRAARLLSHSATWSPRSTPSVISAFAVRSRSRAVGLRLLASIIHVYRATRKRVVPAHKLELRIAERQQDAAISRTESTSDRRTRDSRLHGRIEHADEHLGQSSVVMNLFPHLESLKFCTVPRASLY